MVGVEPSATADGSDKKVMETISEKTFSFAEFELDTAKRLLLKAGQPLALNPKAFDLLTVLVNNHGQILSKDELLDRVWEGSFVEENNLTVHISALRKIFGEKKGEHQFIATIPGKGYKFVAEIRNGDGNFLVKVKESLLPKSVKLADGEAIIGRTAEIAEIKSLFGNKAIGLITLTGAGGAGKTSLAQVVGNELKTDFADGVFFVELAAVRDAELVAPTIMQTLGANESGIQNFAEVLKSFLRTRQIMLILDNFEQIAAAAPFVRELLESSAELKILITSRVALHLETETEFAVSPLSVPPTDANLSFEKLSAYAAVELFVKRAKLIKPHFTLNGENAESIAGICTKLDGLPLAIELAAARIKLLSPESILNRLENSLNLLTGNATTYFQRTMRETVEWSYDLLNENEQILFRQIAVFAGGFTVTAAEAVCENHELQITNYETGESKKQNSKSKIQTLDLLDSLVSNNLLTVKELPDGNVRLRFLEVVREFALECLREKGEIDDLQQIHALYFLSFAEESEMFSSGEIGSDSLEKLENDHDNLRAALDWSLKHDSQTAARIAAALRFFWSNHGHLAEGLAWSKAALQVTENTLSEARSKLLLSNGLFLRNKGDLEAARKIYEQTLGESRQINDVSQIIKANHGLGAIAVLHKDFAVAQIFNEEALAASRKINDEMQIAYSLCSLGDLEMSKQNLSAARPLIEECLQISRKIGNERLLTVAYFNLGTIDYFENKFDGAALNFAESLQIAKKMGNKTMISCALDGFAALEATRANSEQSAKLGGAAETLRELIGYNIEPAEEIFRNEYLLKVRAALGEKRFAALYAYGKTLNSDEASALAIQEHSNEFDEEFIEIVIENHTFERITIEEEIVPEIKQNSSEIKQIAKQNSSRHIWIFALTALMVAAIAFGYWFLKKT